MVCISISNLTLLSISTLSSSKVDIADNAASTTSTLSWCKQDSSLSTALASIKQKLSSAEQTPRWTEHNGIAFLLTNARLSVMFWWGSFARRVAETACFSVIRGLSDGLRESDKKLKCCNAEFFVRVIDELDEIVASVCLFDHRGNGRRCFGILHQAYQDSNKVKIHFFRGRVLDPLDEVEYHSYKGCIPARNISTLYHFDQSRRNSFSNIDYVVRSKHDFPENLYCQTCPYPQWLNYNERVRNSSLIERWAKQSVEVVGCSLKETINSQFKTQSDIFDISI
ncbi:hypothetical protein H5410_025142 [Solanum commersonii]|uniref:Uncharacterized protein n=1 Tax=Solanum commersonii TaxID=4109 RepID=A0A9J5YTE9_SOLCO|nr:hypothetical protein H5410_025142 [Solanum commersonii]